MRAHTVNLVGELMFVFGGCDARTCFNTVYVFDAGKSLKSYVGDVLSEMKNEDGRYYHSLHIHASTSIMKSESSS